jgi:uncharacterized membrane protein (UPF0136 family)
MSAEALTALLAGTVLGLSYAIAGFVMSRKAQTSPDKFMLWVTGGMAVRMFVALSLIAFFLAVVPVDSAIFLGSFLTLFVIGVVFEIAVVWRHQNRRPR